MGNCDVADGHCHLDEGGAGPFDVDFDFDPESTPATPEGVVSVLNGTGPADWPMVLALGRRQPDVVLPQLGIHPWRVPKARDEVDDALGALRGLLEANEHVGLGECGLDKSGAWAETFDNQLYAFRRQVDIAVALRRPLSVHCVRAPSDVLEAVTGVGGRVPVLLHGWAGSAEMTRMFARLDKVYFSLNLTLLNRNARAKSVATVRAVPADRLVLESDRPDGRLRSLDDWRAWFREVGGEGGEEEGGDSDDSDTRFMLERATRQGSSDSILLMARAVGAALGRDPQDVLAQSAAAIRRIFVF